MAAGSYDDKSDSLIDEAIMGTENDDTLIGGAGNDSLLGAEGDDTLTGGAGNDTFVYRLNDGSDVITDFQTGDWLHIEGAGIANAGYEGRDFVFTVGEGNSQGSLRLKDIGSNAVNVKNQYGFYTMKSDSLTLTGLNNGQGPQEMYMSPTWKTLDLSVAEAGVEMYGNTLANVMKGGAGADSISGGVGNDTLYGNAGNDTLNGGAGNDSLIGGAGNDTFVYNAGDGNDIITDYTAGQDTLHISSGSVSKVALSGSNMVFTVGSGTITLKNAGSKSISLKDSRGNYTMTKTALSLSSNFKGALNAANYLATIASVNGSGAANAVTLYGNAGNNTINGGKANDTLYGRAGNDKISGNNGNDSLYGEAGNDNLQGGAGNDSLDGGAGNDTLYGGAGNDTFVFAKSAGKDVVSDYTAGQDTLRISSGSVSKVALANSNKDMVFTVGSGTVTLKGAGAKTVAVRDSRGDYTLNKSALTLKNTFKGAMSTAPYFATITTINGKSATSAVSLTGNAKNNTLYGGSAADTLNGVAGNDKLYGNAGNDKLLGGAGNDSLDGGAGNDVLTGGAGNDTFVYRNDGSKDTIRDYEQGKDTFHIATGTVAKAAISGKNVVFTIGKGTATLTNAAAKTVTMKTGGGTYTVNKTALTAKAGFGGTLDASAHFASVKTVDGRATAKAVNLYGNGGANVLYAGKAGGTLRGGAGNDTLYGGAGKDVFYYDSGNDTVCNYDGKDKLDLGSTFISTVAVAGKDGVLNLANGGRITIKDGATKTISYVDTYGVAETFSFRDVITGTNKNDKLTGSARINKMYGLNGNDSMYGGGGNDVVYGDAGDDSLDGGAGNDEMKGGAGSDKLYGGAGNDWLYGDYYVMASKGNWVPAGNGADYLDGGAGNDTLTGGAGKDTFAYADGGGKDRITDYAAGDLLQITKGSVAKTTLSGGSVVFTVGSGSVTLEGAEGKTVSLKDSRGNYSMTKTALTLSSDFTGTMDATKYLSTVTTIDGRSATKAANLYGNAKNNTIRAGKGGGTLRGYAGDDTLYGGAGKDVFYYDSGNDTIYNYTAGSDTINLGSLTVSAFNIVGNDNVLTLSNGKKVTVKNGAGIKLTVLTKDGKQTVGVNVYNGTSGSDTYTGTTNVDLIRGFAGNDNLQGGDGNDSLYGGDGNDELYGDLWVNGHFEGTGHDYMEGGAGNDWLYGGYGNDTLIGGGGIDQLYGGAGDDYLDDRLDDDSTTDDYTSYLEGGSGNDTLIGGTGANKMKGEWGNDYFWCGSKDGASKDFIEDYNANEDGEDDVIVFMDDLTMTSAGKATDAEYDLDVVITLSNGSTILVERAAGKTITYKQCGQLYTLAQNGAASGMIANSAPIVGSPSARLATLVSTTQAGSLGSLSGTGLASPDASGSGLIAASGTTSNPLGNPKTA